VLDRLKDLVVNFGFTEVINHGLTDENELDFSSGSPVQILNPLSKNYSFLRDSLIPGILKNLRDNHNMKIEKVSVFEIGNIYYMRNSEPSEEPAICLGSMNSFEFFVFKGKIERLLKEIGYDHLSQKIDNCEDGSVIIKFISPVNNVLGRIILPSKGILKKYEIDQEKVFLAEIFLTEFIRKGFPELYYKPLPKILPITRDLSFFVPDSVNWKDVEKFLYENVDMLEDIKIFDIYKGRNVPDGTTSISITVILSNDEGKLTRQKVDEIIDNLVSALEKQFSITLRK
ncbi:MAG: hypothetical protein N2115_06215, partial [bacterium]|nr:hypothetical protein [bacterium]